jgi:putative ABC transport system permease protein
LFGLALFTAEQRTKEIGIRKSNGATTGQVMFILALEFVKWIAISFIIASALAWFVLSNWLNNYAYKTELSWWIFAFTGLITLLIALITVSWQSFRAATRNPVESLRYE